MNRAKPGSHNYSALRTQAARRQTPEATARAKHHGLRKSDDSGSQEWHIPKAPKLQWAQSTKRTQQKTAFRVEDKSLITGGFVFCGQLLVAKKITR